ncbi:MAG: DNA mismatch repair protein MutS [Treponema sp.]|jgi:DNA mismatch repair protein MutS|nr:DNA mismatch repair protein MutS [Treponema sp.]
MMEQYRRIKRDHQGEVLFFRLGDFYEMFAEDALEISALLNLTLTNRQGLPMCGIPYHAARSYIGRLLKYGKKIAVCEQVSEPGKGRGIVEREVIEIITPGTTVDEDYLEKGSFNYLSALSICKDSFSFAYIDLSTGDFKTTSFAVANGLERFRQELERLDAKEMIVQESILELYPFIAESIFNRSDLVVNRWADWLFDFDRSRERLFRQFGTSSLKAFGIADNAPEIVSAGALLDYIDNTAKSILPHIQTISLYNDNEYISIDESSIRNLELIRNLRDGDVRYSLFEVMDETKTAMGRRLLKSRILHPLRNIDIIRNRLTNVETIYHDQNRLNMFRELFGKTPDLERLCSRLAMDKAHGKDMISIRNSLITFKEIHEISTILNLNFEKGCNFAENDFHHLMELKELLEHGLIDEPSILLTEGNLIREGFSAELDKLRLLRDEGRNLLEAYLEEEREHTGIQTLKIRYNRLIGYFFEVGKAHLSKVPQHFIRRQGIVGGERFSTERLAALESEINGAHDKVVELEKTLFLEMRERAKKLGNELSSAARRIAELDVSQSLARAAVIHGWTRPELSEENSIAIEEGRHPVVEAHLGRGEFVPNNIFLDGEDISFALITGPNMAGKSTYLRQAALIVIMAQTGSFIPAKNAVIGIVDRIYCRVGASDNLARGESTFLVEMNETAHILHTATNRSLVIMDEVGRGTGTNDGLSIAWAICDELLDHIQCRTLFATHYHELAMIEHPKMANRSMEVLDRDGEIVFLRKLKDGAAEESYGLHVAKLAGIPERVLEKAERIMTRLKLNERNISGEDNSGSAKSKKETQVTSSASVTVLHSVLPQERSIIDDIIAIDPDRLTPVEALNRIHVWNKMIKDGSVPAKKRGRKPEEPDQFPSLFD